MEPSKTYKLSKPYELNRPVEQLKGTWQCWWLALLEVLRVSGKLEPIFTGKGDFSMYYEKRRKDLRTEVPEVGQLPNGLDTRYSAVGRLVHKKDKTGKLTLDPTKMKLFVYGPVWQRMIMFFLLDTAGIQPWNLPHVTVMTSQRQEELESLLEYLGAQGVSFGASQNIFGPNIRAKLGALKEAQYLIVDKKSGATGHCMPGMVELLPFQVKKKVDLPSISKPQPNTSTVKGKTATAVKLPPIDNSQPTKNNQQLSKAKEPKKSNLESKVDEEFKSNEVLKVKEESPRQEHTLLVWNQSTKEARTCRVVKKGQGQQSLEGASGNEMPWVINWLLPINIASLPSEVVPPGTTEMKAKL